MKNIDIEIKLLEHGKDLALPTYETESAAGMDLRAANIDDITLKPSEFKLIPTGISIALPIGFEAQIRPRSGLAAKNGITVLNSPGTIDADYRGEIKIILINHGKSPFTIKRGNRIAQMVIAPTIQANWLECDNLEKTTRGSGGFGSTSLT